VEFREAQTCCGQPGFNAGDWPAARRVARHALRVFAGDAPVVVPSGSCARMASHGALLLFEGEPELEHARQLAGRSFELADFLVRELGVAAWPGRFPARLAFHRSCHSRGTAYAESALTLLASIAGVELVEFDEAEQCCGFGGTFSVTFPRISRGMGELKLDAVIAAAPDALVSADSGCLLQLAGLAEKQGRTLRMLHLAQVLRDALSSAGPGAAA
jgi:L-lactate dehydrogenase complex protein LldE